MKNQQETNHFAICVCNEGYEASLEKRNCHEVLADSDAAKYRQTRAIDESGEDYLYPEDYLSKSLFLKKQSAHWLNLPRDGHLK